MSGESTEPTPYAVRCPSHGQVFLDREEYMQQLSAPYDRWRCPCCGDTAWWDDGNFEKGMVRERAEYMNRHALICVRPEDCDPPHAASDTKTSELVGLFKDAGFDEDHPALIGYPLNGRIQLLSGSHRHAAAIKTNTKLPVTLWLQSDINAAWGDLEEWAKIMRQIPVKEFER